jgi:CheY-like chemotaxis protein
MSPDVLKRAMEPFFTTKEIGYGTGLGLATVYSIVQQSGGFVAINSTLGKGTTVRLYFPKAEAVPRVKPTSKAPNTVPLGDGELVLVVEDNDAVREATVSRLQSLGYDALEARTGAEAIQLLKMGEPVALVFADIVMPGGVTGYDVAKWARSRKPDLKVLLTSGYANPSPPVKDGVREIKVLGKPYTREQLAQAVRESLQGSIEGGTRADASANHQP